MRLINERIQKGADPTTGGARLSLSDLSKDNTQQITYDSGEDDSGGGTDPGDTTPPGDENQFAFAPPGQIGYFDPETGTYTLVEFHPTYESYCVISYGTNFQVFIGGVQ